MKLLAVAVAVLAVVQQPSIESVLERLDAYLTAYEPLLSELIADEDMTQQVNRSTRVASTENDLPVVARERRRLESEVAFMALPNDVGWFGFRHIKRLDNRAVKDADRSLTAALRSDSLDPARALLASSAEHNLGQPRTNNLPNLPLEFLHPRNRRRLAVNREGSERIRGVDTVRLAFVERATPTLITNQINDSDMPSTVRAWINPQSGELLRAEVLTFAARSATIAASTIRVDFTRNAALGMLVPAEMRERFPVSGDAAGESLARYKNFRRFQTSARIVQQ